MFHPQLKFKNQTDVIDICNLFDLPSYFSSGTIKGLIIFAGVNEVLATGGFLIVDEIENHFNETVVKSIIQMFQNKKINVTGTTLCFSVI